MSEQPEQALWACNICGFTVPIDEIGKAWMMEHLREHRRQEREAGVGRG